MQESAAWRAALYIGVLVCFLTSILCFFILQSSDPLTFAWIGTRFAERDPQGTVGYDGQFAYYIARDGAAAVPYIDGPSLRYQRIFYPILARVLSLGMAELLPWALIIINVIAHSLGAALLTFLVVYQGGPAYSGLIYACWIGALFSVRFNLNESLCFALSLTAVLFYSQARFRWTVVFLILAALTKELGLIFAGGLSLHAAVNRRFSWSLLLMFGPLLAFGLWWMVLRLWFGTLPTIYPAARFRLIPFYGVLLEDAAIEFILLVVWLVIPSVVLLLAAMRHIWITKQLRLSTALLLSGAGFVWIMPPVSWVDPVAAYRVAASLIITGVFFVGDVYPERLKWLAALWLPGLLAFFMLIVAMS